MSTPLREQDALVIAVVGTGTGVGKTSFTVALTRALRSHPGLQGAALAWKPIETGQGETGQGEDSAALEEVSQTPLSPLYLFREPVSPHLAARREGKQIEIERVVQESRDLRSRTRALVIETAGGLFSPLRDDGSTNEDLVVALAPTHIILVAPNRLGVLHDVTAVRRGSSLSISGTVLAHPPTTLLHDASRGSNAAELRRLGGDWIEFHGGALDASATATMHGWLGL